MKLSFPTHKEGISTSAELVRFSARPNDNKSWFDKGTCEKTKLENAENSWFDVQKQWFCLRGAFVFIFISLPIGPFPKKWSKSGKIVMSTSLTLFFFL